MATAHSWQAAWPLESARAARAVPRECAETAEALQRDTAAPGTSACIPALGRGEPGPRPLQRFEIVMLSQSRRCAPYTQV